MESKSLLCLDVPTRWNSTYLTLETTEKFEKVFLRMDFEDDGYSSYFRSKEDSGGLGSPCMSDFQNCRAFVTFLRIFTMQQRSSLALCMLPQMPFLMRSLLFRRVFLI